MQIDALVSEIAQADAQILNQFDAQVRSASGGRCELGAEVSERMVNAAGFAHGALAYALMDTASAYALATLARRGVTTNGNVTYIRGAAADMKLHVVSEVVSCGRSNASLRAELFHVDEGEPVLLAHASFVFALLD